MNILLHLATNQLKWQHSVFFVTFTTTTSLSWNGWFHFTNSASKLVSGSVMGVFGSMVHWLVDCFIMVHWLVNFKKWYWEVHV